jgi:hypothetical protein
VPMWVYRAAMLAWAVWLAVALIGWIKWALAAWIKGDWWKPLREPKAAPAAPQAAPPANDAPGD